MGDTLFNAGGGLGVDEYYFSTSACGTSASGHLWRFKIAVKPTSYFIKDAWAIVNFFFIIRF